jgi:hypothetical protein
LGLALRHWLLLKARYGTGPLRLEFAVAIYHLTSRGNDRQKQSPSRYSSGSETIALQHRNRPDSNVVAQEIVEDLDAALEQFREIAGGEHVNTTET